MDRAEDESGAPVSPLHAGALEQLQKFFRRNAELPEDLEEQGRPDLAAAVERNRNRPAIWMVPSLVTSGLPRF
jgi:hypothetical protein